jgi:hypothetical protein
MRKLTVSFILGKMFIQENFAIFFNPKAISDYY